MRRLILGLASATTVFGLVRLLRPPPLRYPLQTMALMEAMDDDGDGRLGEAEFRRRAPAATPLSVFDLNESEHIEAHELEAMMLAVDPLWLAHPPR
jgi:hypothetical protein